MNRKRFARWPSYFLFYFLLSILLVPLVGFASTKEEGQNRSPIGYWKTIDDITAKPKSILHIYQVKGSLVGQIERIFPKPGYDQNELCTACKGAKHNQRMVGMVIMEGLKQNADLPLQWINGRILDPENGKTYRCQLKLSENGQQLNVRGYIGVPLFGRSQTWLREGS